jgi:WhiB family redox-sensing transcriptional regulator
MGSTRRVGAYTQATHGLDDSWMENGACRTAEVSTYFVDNQKGVRARRIELAAKQRCWGCDVQAECLSYALAGGVQGIWGGLNEKERDAVITQRRAVS